MIFPNIIPYQLFKICQAWPQLIKKLSQTKIKDLSQVNSERVRSERKSEGTNARLGHKALGTRLKANGATFFSLCLTPYALIEDVTERVYRDPI